MAEFTRYELESIKQQSKLKIQKDLRARRLLKIKIIVIFCFMSLAIFLIYKLINKGNNILDDKLKEDMPMSKDYDYNQKIKD